MYAREFEGAFEVGLLIGLVLFNYAIWRKVQTVLKGEG